MENRITGRFVVNSSDLEEVDTRAAIENLILNSVGYTYEQSGKLLDIIVTVKTVPGPTWAKCQQLGYYGSSSCGTLNPPGTTCTKAHHHKPELDDDGVCAKCTQLGIPTPRVRGDEYNHPNSKD